MTVLLPGILAVCAEFAFAQAVPSSLPIVRATDQRSAIEKTRKLLEEVRAKSYPEISDRDIKVEAFSSKSDFFKARFSFTRYLTFRHIKTIIYVNPAVFAGDVSEDALAAILAHELAHALYFGTRNRLRLLGLLRLTCNGFAAEFERKADLVAISRGYGEGLIEYRDWLYKTIPAKSLETKKRNYFSPEEIRILSEVIKKDPMTFEKFTRRVPKTLSAIIDVAKSIEPK